MTFQKLTESRVQSILEANLPETVLVYLGENQQLEEMTEKLMGLNKTLDLKLASNKQLTTEQLTALYEKYGDEFALELSKNPNLESRLLEKFYTKGDERLIVNIASNPATPQAILDALVEKNQEMVNRALALNPSTKLIYLEQFALDSELRMLMRQNQTYIESINSAQTGMKSDDRY